MNPLDSFRSLFKNDYIEEKSLDNLQLLQKKDEPEDKILKNDEFPTENKSLNISSNWLGLTLSKNASDFLNEL